MKTDDQVLFGRQVRAVREAVSISRDVAAEKAGITSNYLGEVERGEKWPSLEVILAVARALGVSPSAFFEFEAQETDASTLIEKLHQIVENRTVEQKQQALRVLKGLFEP